MYMKVNPPRTIYMCTYVKLTLHSKQVTYLCSFLFNKSKITMINGKDLKPSIHFWTQKLNQCAEIFGTLD